MIAWEMSGDDEFDRMAAKLERAISPLAMAAAVLKVATEAGQVLKYACVRACIEAVYAHPLWGSSSSVTPSDFFSLYGGNAEERTEDLLNSIVLIDNGFSQIVQVDPEMPVSSNAHAGRELVIDYAIPVHEGYTQWIPDGRGGSRDTGIFHEGRFWFRVAEIEAAPVIFAFIEKAFGDIVSAIVKSL